MHGSRLLEVLRCPLYVNSKANVVCENVFSIEEEKKKSCLFFCCLKVLFCLHNLE